MATSAATPYPSYYEPYEDPTVDPRFGYQNSSDARKLASNQRAVVQSTGDNLMNADQQLASQYAKQASGVENYLSPIESKLAAGQGGYSPDEARQIEYSDQDANNLVNKAGVTAGQQTAASVGAAERAAAAGGGSPAALATYRARAAQTAGVNAGDAMTDARVAAKNLQSTGAQTVGNARLGQQQEGLNYYSGLQQQKNSNALSEQGLQQGAYGTQTSGTNDAAGLGLKASQTPSTSDKVIGGVSGAAKALLLADGLPNYMDDGQDAVVGENGMEAVIENAPKAVMNGTSDPVRSHTTFMDNGFPGDGDYGGEAGGSAVNGDYGGETGSPATPQAPKQPNFLQRYLQGIQQKNQGQQQKSSGDQEWNKTTPYQEAGSAIGQGVGLLAAHLADGDSGQPWWKDIATHEGESMLHAAVPDLFAGPSMLADGHQGCDYMADGAPSTDQGTSMQADGRNGMQVGNTKIFTQPTRIRLDKSDAVVPLTFRPKAKVRPSAALPAMQGRGMAHAS